MTAFFANYPKPKLFSQFELIVGNSFIHDNIFRGGLTFCAVFTYSPLGHFVCYKIPNEEK